MAKKDSMPKKNNKAKQEKVTEDLTPEKDPKGGGTTIASTSTATIASTTATPATLVTPARPAGPILGRRGR